MKYEGSITYLYHSKVMAIIEFFLGQTDKQDYRNSNMPRIYRCSGIKSRQRWRLAFCHLPTIFLLYQRFKKKNGLHSFLVVCTWFQFGQVQKFVV